MFRHFIRILVVGAVAGIALGAGVYFLRNKAAAAPEATRAAQDRPLPVKVTPLQTRTFERTVSAQGNVQAKRYANVPARVFGPLDAVFVDDGDAVEKGKTKLFQVDHEKLARAVTIAEQDLALAQCQVRESEANLARVQADLDKATVDVNRFQRLAGKSAVTQDALEQQESRHKQITAMKNHAEAMLDLSHEQTRKAEAALEIARRTLSDSTVYAPLSGVIVKRMSEPGEIAEPGKPVVRIEDTSLLEVSVFIPAEHYADVVPGETEMRVQCNGADLGAFPVSYKSASINPALRTFEVQCLLPEEAAGVAPGAMAHVRVALDREDALGAPRDAILQRDGSAVLFVVEGERARMAAVQPGIPDDGWIAIQGDGLSEGMQVVTTGQDMLNDGSAVAIQKDGD